MRKSATLILFFWAGLLVSYAQVKGLHAVKTDVAPKLDGSLDEEVWKQAPAAVDFITNTPVYGKPASAKTEVRVLYDHTAIYIGAYIHDDPSLVRKQFTPRDQIQTADVDYFSVFLDTYHDRQNAYQFFVTSRNVQGDARVSPLVTTNFGQYGDLSWDAVWDSRVSFKNDGWVVEMKIPYFSIRFSKNNDQVWGLQFMRFMRRNNETSFWNAVDPNVNGFANQFGDLSGLSNLLPPLRLSFSPYISGGYRGTPTAGGYQNEWLRSGGMDVKYGIDESFTLDATLIPDFGQVISDNVVNNISPYEIQFRENRPFFTEGTEIFNKAGIFYSRRVGEVPELYDYVNDAVNGGSLKGYSIIKNPQVTRLYNATKFSGRTHNNLGIGIFNAIGEQVEAVVRNATTKQDSTIITEPLTNYNVLVLDQALKNRSYITFTNTNVLREGQARDANVTALDLAFYDKRNLYGIVISPRYSKIFDSIGGYDGFKNFISVGKVSGRFQYSLSNDLVSDKYDPNDIGYLASPNSLVTELAASYNIYDATPRFLNQRYSLSVQQSHLYKPFEYQSTIIKASLYWIFRNFWDISLRTEIMPEWQTDYFDLQTPQDLRATPRQPLKKAPNYFFSFNGSTDSRKRLFVNWDLGFAQSPNPNDPFHSVLLGMRYRFNDRFTLSLSGDWRDDNGQFGYAFVRDETSNAPILARRKYTDVTAIMSGIYNFTPRMNITFRARHFWNRIRNSNFYDVDSEGYWTERFDYIVSDYNTNYNAFNLDVFYTWDFRLGSRIVLGWKNWMGRDFEYDVDGVKFSRYSQNLGQVFNTAHGNEVTLRFIYFLNYDQLKRKQ